MLFLPLQKFHKFPEERKKSIYLLDNSGTMLSSFYIHQVVPTLEWIIHIFLAVEMKAQRNCDLPKVT